MDISTWPIHGILTGTTSLGQGGPGSNGNEGVPLIPLSFQTETSPSDGLVPYPGYWFGGLTSAEMQSVYSTAPANWAEDDNSYVNNKVNINANVDVSSNDNTITGVYSYISNGGNVQMVTITNLAVMLVIKTIML